MKLLTRLLITFLMITCFANCVSADNNSYCFKMQESEEQELTIRNQDGTVEKISVVYTPIKITALSGAKTINSGVYTIKSQTANLTLSFDILVNGGNIVSVYNGSYSSPVYTVSNPQLVRLSLKKAKYSVSINSFPTTTKWLQCEINDNDQLVITKNY